MVPAQVPFVRVARSWSQPEIPKEQLAQIRLLLERAGIDEGLAIRDGVSLFLVDTHGMAARGWAKGYAYLPDAPPAASLRALLDNPRALPHGLFLRPIPGAQGWYVFVDR